MNKILKPWFAIAGLVVASLAPLGAAAGDGAVLALALAEHGHQLALGVKLQNEPGLTAGDFDAR